MNNIKNKNFILTVIFFLIIATFTFGNAKSIYVSVRNSSKKEIILNIKKFENNYNKEFLFRENFVEFHGFIQKIMFKNVVYDVQYENGIVKDDWGRVNFVIPPKSLNNLKDTVVNISNNIPDNIPVLFVQAPFKIMSNTDILPSGIKDFTNEAADELLTNLKSNDIDFLDLRDEIEKDNLKKEDLFYKTDHHWKNPTVFWAYKKIVNTLKERYNIKDLDPQKIYTDDKNYNKQLFSNVYLGSQGRRTGVAFSGLDDYILYTPKFLTNFEISFLGEGNDSVKRGTFEDVIINKGFSQIEKPYSTTLYSSYIGFDSAKIIIKNNTNKNGKKILVIKDSFGLPLSAFLSFVSQEVCVIDLRAYKEDVSQYITEYKPDVVLFVYNPDQ